ncbi:MAG: DNA double-strand break repair nuclease NurA [Anaerolineales bacterium]|jgi:hypothetical protein
MSLDIPQLFPQLHGMVQTAAEQAAELQRLLPKAEQALDSCASIDAQELMDKIQRAGQFWKGVLPTNEPINAVIPPPDKQETFTTIGADGSQIYPNRHALTLYFLINIGSIIVKHGSGEAPLVVSRPAIFYEAQDLYPESSELISSALVNGKRDAAEMNELARLADEEQAQPTLALLDNGLILWIASREMEQPSTQVEIIKSDYLRSMQVIKDSGAALAGYIDRPRTTNVLRLLHLASLPLEAINDENLRAHPFQPLTDQMVFAQRLPAGHRSCRFGLLPENKDFARAGHNIQCFYLNTGYQDQIARVEIPVWVAENQILLDLVHAGILEECRVTGMPYVLARAHELAVVSQPDRLTLERALNTLLLERGILSDVSQKELAKRWVRPDHRPPRRSPLP